VDTIEQVAGRRRRRHSAEFKAQMIAACQQPGVSSAAIALAHSVNANLLRRWVKEAARSKGTAVRRVMAAASGPEAFIALPVRAKPASGPPIQIEVRRGPTTVIVQWPVTALQECSAWLRELLR
jgi:transposase-like protein